MQSFQLKVSLFWILWILFSLIILTKQQLYSPKQHPYTCMCMSSYRPIMGGAVLVKFTKMYQLILTVTFGILPSFNFFSSFFFVMSHVYKTGYALVVSYFLWWDGASTQTSLFIIGMINDKLQYCRPSIRQCVVAHLAQSIQWFCLHSCFDTVYIKLCSNARGRNAIRQALELQLCK